ncbi:MAG: hypothetical protein ACTSQG_11190, partial [Promethearchaeota archaeon]
KDVLKIVPMKDMGWKNDGQGNRPKEFDEWVRELAEGLLELITALIAAIGDFIAGLVEAAIEAGLKFVQAIVAAVMAAIEAIVKAALLAFIYLEFALFAAGMALYFLTLLTSLYFVTLAYGGSLSLNDLSLEYKNYGSEFVIKLELYWKYYHFLEFEVPYSVFSIKFDDNLMLKVETGLITSFQDICIIKPPKISPCEQEVGSSAAYNNDNSSDKKFLNSNLSSNELISGTNNISLNWSSTEDADGDGLPDWWEIENAEVFTGLFGSDPLKVGVKDLIVEVDYIEGFKPTSKNVEIFCLAIAIILTVFTAITWISPKIYDIIKFFMIGFAGWWWLNKPYESFYRITKYFSKKEGHSIHILYDPEDSKITLKELNSIEGLEDFNGWDASDDELRLIESIFHNDYRQRLNDTNLGVYILYIGNHKENTLATGKADTAPGGAEPFGAVICKRRISPLFLGYEYWTFAHELGHLLHLGHNNQESTNYMNELGNPLYFPFPFLLHYDDSEWNDMDYVGRISAG